jgi:hypothetical protein
VRGIAFDGFEFEHSTRRFLNTALRHFLDILREYWRRNWYYGIRGPSAERKFFFFLLPLVSCCRFSFSLFPVIGIIFFPPPPPPPTAKPTVTSRHCHFSCESPTPALYNHSYCTMFQSGIPYHETGTFKSHRT